MSQISEEQVKPTETMLKDQREAEDNQSIDDSGNIEYRLKDNRTSPDGQETTQKQLEAVRTANDGQEITEAAMERGTKGKFNLAKYRVEDRQSPLMDYAKTNEFSNDKLAKKKDEEKRDTEFWDKFVGDQLDYEPTKIVANSQPSQLLSNFETREDFEKENNSIKKTAETLKDADAMLYYIYRKAATESREATVEERQMIDDINSGKIRVIAQMRNEEPIDEELRVEESTKAADDMEERRSEEEILRQQREIAEL